MSDSRPYGPIACQTPLSIGFSGQEYGCHALLQGLFPTQGLNLCLLHLPALAGGFFIISATWEAQSDEYLRAFVVIFSHIDFT